MKFINGWILNIGLVLLICNSISATDFRFRVYLKDKGTDFSSLAYPERFLSSEALNRRSKAGIAVDETDLPISPAYFSQLEDSGFQIVTYSKWMKTIVVETTDSIKACQLINFPMVASVKRVWSGERQSQSKWNTDTTFLYVNEVKQRDFYGYAKTQLDLLNGRKLHKAGFRGKGICIAVIDAGFRNADRMEVFSSIRVKGLRNVAYPNYSVYDGDDHGTKVLSCLAANIPGVLVGTAPDADYWLIQSEDSESEFPIEEDYWLAAAEYADSVGVDIITSSLGYYTFDDKSLAYQHQDLDGQTALISQAATMAARKGILVFTSAGNEGNGVWHKITVPADAAEVLTVGAVEKNKKRSIFSSLGYSADGRVKPDLVAMGTDCAVIGPLGDIQLANGTSFSTPILAGMAACLWQALPWLTAKELRNLLIRSASQYQKPDKELGYGVPNIYKLYKKESKRHESGNYGNKR